TATDIELAALVPGANVVADNIGHGLTAGKVKSAISVAEVGQTNVASVSATYSDPTLAAAIANGFATEFIAERRASDEGNVKQALALVQQQIKRMSPVQAASSVGLALIQRATSLQTLANLQTGDAEIVTSASPPTSPSSPRTKRDLVIGIALGLLLGLLLVLTMERFDRTLNDVADIEEAFEMTLLGAVPASSALSRSPRSGGRRADLPHADAEAFRMLRAYLRYFQVDHDLRTILITSPASGDGKTTVACRLAETAAKMGSRVLLLEADLRKPSVAAQFGIENSPGLSEVLISAVDSSEAIRPLSLIAENADSNGSSHLGLGSLDILTAGMVPPNPAQLIESEAMHRMMSWAASNYELIIVDTPPLLAVADAIPLLKQVDGVMVVARAGKTTRDAAWRIRKELVSMGAPTSGVVANGINTKSGSYEYRYASGAYDTSNAAKTPVKTP
ncbi:MAG: polysaccharide biosynthesis tyrosine autokinase, partial [Solirubrobacteraceae bacterium]